MRKKLISFPGSGWLGETLVKEEKELSDADVKV
jgi:hypothetical protein